MVVSSFHPAAAHREAVKPYKSNTSGDTFARAQQIMT
jgi:hypothetical protein